MNSGVTEGACLLGIMLIAFGVLGILALAAEARMTGRHNWFLVLGAVFMATVGIWFVRSACF